MNGNQIEYKWQQTATRQYTLNIAGTLRSGHNVRVKRLSDGRWGVMAFHPRPDGDAPTVSIRLGTYDKRDEAIEAGQRYAREQIAFSDF